MKGTLFFILVLMPHLLAGQNRTNEIFLMYKKTVAGPIVDFGQGFIPSDTIFFGDDVFVIKDSKALIKQLNIYDHDKNRPQKWKFQKSGNDITITREKTYKGRIIYNNILKKENYSNIDFLLIPLVSGLQLTKFEGQLIFPNKDKIILDVFDNRTGLQRTNYLLNQNGYADNRYGMTNYRASKEGNLVYIGVADKLFQLIKKESDSIMYFNSFNGTLRRNDTIRNVVKVLYQNMPKEEFLSKRSELLQGEWKLSHGEMFNDSTLTFSDLGECFYKFQLTKEKLIVSRTFANHQYKDSSDTLRYSLNSTGDYLRIANQDAHIFKDAIIRHLDGKTLSWVLEDVWIMEDKRRRIKLFLKMVRN